MSTTPRKNRSDNERRRRAKEPGLKQSSTWSEVEAASIDRDHFVRLAERYGLDDSANWDDIYSAFQRRIHEGRTALRAAKAALIGASLFLVVALIWFNWLTILIAILVFLVIFILMFFGYSHENSEHVYFMLGYSEIKERARRDGLFDLQGD
jgi:Flp pilus assembly protein TadB